MTHWNPNTKTSIYTNSTLTVSLQDHATFRTCKIMFLSSFHVSSNAPTHNFQTLKVPLSLKFQMLWCSSASNALLRFSFTAVSRPLWIRSQDYRSKLQTLTHSFETLVLQFRTWCFNSISIITSSSFWIPNNTIKIFSQHQCGILLEWVWLPNHEIVIFIRLFSLLV